MSITLDKIPPGLHSLVKTAAVSLEKSGLTGQRAAVYLVLDHSGSMGHFYHRGDVQRLAEQALGLSANLDDDGVVPVVLFDSDAYPAVNVRLNAYQGAVDRIRAGKFMAGTRYVPAMQAVIAHYQASGAADPALVIWQSDGDPQDRDATEDALRDASNLPIFWATVGFGPKDRLGFLRRLDKLRGRKVDNASFFHAANPQAVSDSELYDGITGEFAGWLKAARAAGILR